MRPYKPGGRAGGGPGLTGGGPGGLTPLLASPPSFLLGEGDPDRETERETEREGEGENASLPALLTCFLGGGERDLESDLELTDLDLDLDRELTLADRREAFLRTGDRLPESEREREREE